MKILRVVSDLYPSSVGGLGIHAHELSKLQSKMGLGVTVFTSNPNNLSSYELKDGYQIKRFRPTFKIGGNPISARLLYELYRERNNYDIIHAHSHLFLHTNASALIKKFSSTPLVITNHGLISQSFPLWFNNLYISTIGKLTLKSADKIICYTDNEKESLEHLGITPNKIAVIHNGINTHLFCPDDKKYISNNILWIGRFVPGKDVECLLDAFKIIISYNPMIKLIMIGEGPLKDKILNKIKLLNLSNNVTIIDFLPNSELPSFYNNSDIFVLPSLYEGVPRTILEAMSCEVPVVCTNLPQLKNIVDGCGYLVPSHNPKAIADRVLTILSDDNLRLKFGNNGRCKILKYYSWEETVKQINNLYKELLENKIQ